MSPVNAFHVYSSGDLSRHRERKKKKKIHRSESRFRVSFQTSTRLFYQPKWIIARIFLVTLTPIVIFFNVLLVDQKIHSWKFCYACSSTCVQTQHFPTWRGSDYTWIRSRRAITRLFTQPRAFFFVIPPFHTCKCMIINSRRIDIMYLYHL